MARTSSSCSMPQDVGRPCALSAVMQSLLHRAMLHSPPLPMELDADVNDSSGHAGLGAGGAGAAAGRNSALDMATATDGACAVCGSDGGGCDGAAAAVGPVAAGCGAMCPDSGPCLLCKTRCSGSLWPAPCALLWRPMA